MHAVIQAAAICALGIGLTLVVLGWSPSPSRARARTIAARAQIESFQTACGAYRRDTGTFPSSQQGLAALRTRPAGVPRWDGPYLPKSIPLDPWGHPYIYEFPGPHPGEPGIASLGADGRPGGEGNDSDIVSWKQ